MSEHELTIEHEQGQNPEIPKQQLVPWAALMPRNFAEALELADRLAKSTLVPVSFRSKPGDIIVAIQWGAEIGLRPLQSLNSVAVINGRPGIFGDAALALVWSSGLCLSYDDCIEGDGDDSNSWIGVARSWRNGTPGPIERRFSVIDARRANLWTKSGPWEEYPRRMLILRARGFLLRDLYPDVLRGTLTVEEIQDTPLKQIHTPRFVVDEERFNKTLGLPQTDAGPGSLDNTAPRKSPTPTTTRPAPFKVGG